jgi:hypothetical protein
VARILEIGGRNDRVFPASPSARFGRGFFSSINDTVSMTGFGGFAPSTGLAGASACAFATAACDFRAASVWERDFDAGAAGTGAFAWTSSLAVLASLSFGSEAERDEPAALTGLRTVVVLRAAVLLVVFVAMSVPEKIGHGRLVRRSPFYFAAGVS